MGGLKFLIVIVSLSFFSSIGESQSMSMAVQGGDLKSVSSGYKFECRTSFDPQYVVSCGRSESSFSLTVEAFGVGPTMMQKIILTAIGADEKTAKSFIVNYGKWIANQESGCNSEPVIKFLEKNFKKNGSKTTLCDLDISVISKTKLSSIVEMKKSTQSPVSWPR